MAATLDLKIDQGSYFSNQIEITNEDGSPVDLTNCSFIGQARKKKEDVKASFFFDFAVSNQAITGNLGKFSMSLSRACPKNPLFGTASVIAMSQMTNRHRGGFVEVLGAILSQIPRCQYTPFPRSLLLELCVVAVRPPALVRCLLAADALAPTDYAPAPSRSPSVPCAQILCCALADPRRHS